MATGGSFVHYVISALLPTFGVKRWFRSAFDINSTLVLYSFFRGKPYVCEEERHGLVPRIN